MRKIIICGAGGHGVEIKTIIEDINEVEQRWEIAGFVDASIAAESVVSGLSVLGDDQYLLDSTESVDVVLAVAQTQARERLYSMFSRNKALSFPSLIHPRAYIAKDVLFEQGVVISQFCIVSPKVSLNKFVFLHGGVFIGHDAVIGSFSLIMPHAAVLGSVTVGDKCLVGAQASIRQGLSLGNNAVVGMGSVVVKNVPDGAIVMGNPARSN